jgi:hypothetical protein
MWWQAAGPESLGGAAHTEGGFSDHLGQPPTLKVATSNSTVSLGSRERPQIPDAMIQAHLLASGAIVRWLLYKEGTKTTVQLQHMTLGQTGKR